MELYKRKHSDDQWMGELAAVQASSMAELPYLPTSGIMLTGENFHGNPLERTGSSDPLSDTSDKSKGMFFIKDWINLNSRLVFMGCDSIGTEFIASNL